MFALGALLGEQTKDDQAKVLLHKAATLRPDHPSPYLELGKIAMHEHSYEEALQYLRAAVERDPKSKTATYLLATALNPLGRKQEARAVFARSRQLFKRG
ncbi:MAG: tetratricopeptide repeat protein [Rudaea sp.]